MMQEDKQIKFTLHSNIFKLIQNGSIAFFVDEVTLHSNIFKLIPFTK